MKKEYSNYLKKQFVRKFTDNFPKFKLTNINSIYSSPGELVFVNTDNEGLKLFIIIVKHPKGGDKFTIELGWSNLNNFPELSVRPSIEPPQSVNISTKNEYVCRIGSLIHNVDKWWVLKDSSLFKIKDPIQKLIAQSKKLNDKEVESIVQPQINKAIEDIKIYGLPYFEKMKSMEMI